MMISVLMTLFLAWYICAQFVEKGEKCFHRESLLDARNHLMPSRHDKKLILTSVTKKADPQETNWHSSRNEEANPKCLGIIPLNLRQMPIRVWCNLRICKPIFVVDNSYCQEIGKNSKKQQHIAHYLTPEREYFCVSRKMQVCDCLGAFLALRFPSKVCVSPS